MSKLFTSRPLWKFGTVIVRAFAGWLIIRHSLELFHPGLMKQLIDFLTDVKFPFPVFSGYAAKIIEFVGGIFLIVGFLTRIFAPLLSIVMYGVVFTMGHGSIYDGEQPFLFLLIFMLFFFEGPGRYSVDYWLFDKRREDKTKV